MAPKLESEPMPNPVSPENSKKVSVIGTGGTICSCAGEGKRPVYDPAAVASRVPALAGDALLSFREVARKDSTDLVPADMVRLAVAIHEEAAKADGIVVLCGTDNLAATATAQKYLLQDLPIPVAFTGAMKSIDEPGSDAPANFVNAVRVSRSELAGHFLVFHGRIINPGRARKRSSINADAFSSAGGSQVGTVDAKRVFLTSEETRRRGDGEARLHVGYEARVATHHLDMHDEPDSLERYATLAGLRGLVLVAHGTGGIRRDLAPSVNALCELGLIVAVVSSADSPMVRLQDYEVGQRLLEIPRVIPCVDLLPHAAAAKLRWALSANGPTPSPEQVGVRMLRPVDFDMSGSREEGDKSAVA